jgi:hypothetical protein
MERIDDILTLLCNYERSRMAPSTPPCPKPHHIPNNIVTPDAIASRDPAARGAFYPRREFKVRWLSGYRLGGRYDDMVRIENILTLFCNHDHNRVAPSTQPSQSHITFQTTPSSQTPQDGHLFVIPAAQRAGTQLLGGTFYPRREFKVWRFSGYRLGGRYDDMERIDDILTLFCNHDHNRVAPSTQSYPTPQDGPSSSSLTLQDNTLTRHPGRAASREPAARGAFYPPAGVQSAAVFWIPARRPV